MPIVGICETCGNPILKLKDAWIEWVVLPNGTSIPTVRNMRLVHHRPASPLGPDGSCQFDQASEFRKDEGIVNDRSLKDYVRPDGRVDFSEHLTDPAFRHIDLGELATRVWGFTSHKSDM